MKNITENEEKYEISIEQPRKTCICPCCGKGTNKIHDYRYQRVKELSAFEKKVVLILRKRRYVCSCGKRFAEPNTFLAKYQRMTQRAIMGLLDKLTIQQFKKSNPKQNRHRSKSDVCFVYVLYAYIKSQITDNAFNSQIRSSLPHRKHPLHPFSEEFLPHTGQMTTLAPFQDMVHLFSRSVPFPHIHRLL